MATLTCGNWLLRDEGDPLHRRQHPLLQTRSLIDFTKNNPDYMPPSYKPNDYSTVSPYLILDGAGATIEFLKQVFGGVELRRFPDDEGRLMHAEVKIDDTVIMLADGNPDWPPIASNVHVYVADVDAVYQQALAAGATSVQEPVKKDDEDKRGGVKDSGGTTWWIATRVE